MGANKKPRKAYVPRPKNEVGGLLLLSRAGISSEPVTDQYAGELEMIALTALESVVRGTGTTREWDCLARCINQSWTLAHNEIGSEVIPTLHAANDAMKRMAKRFKAGQPMGFDGEGLTAVRRALEIWGDQLRISTIGEVDAATRVVEKHYAEVTVCA